MPTYRFRETGAVVSLDQLAQMHQMLAFPLGGPDVAMLDYLGVDMVFDAPPPALQPWESAIPTAPVKTSKGGYEQGWRVVDLRDSMTAEEKAAHLAGMKATRKAAATDLRWQKEVAGIAINGVPVATDDRSKTLILGKRAKARENPDMTFRWKSASGEWVNLTGAQIIAIADAVADHVQACFDREGDLHDAIDAAETAEDVLAVDIAEGWPG